MNPMFYVCFGLAFAALAVWGIGLYLIEHDIV